MTTAIITDINTRIHTLMMDLGQAKDIVGTSPDISPATNEAARELLRVEKLAVRDRQLNDKSWQTTKQTILTQLHHEILARFKQELEDTDTLYSKVLGINESMPDALDILNVRASSIGRIEPVIATMPWLVKDLIKMVNMPKYRRFDKRGKGIAVDNLRMALSFIGIENLKMVVPSMAMRRWLPQITDPYPSIKSRLWANSIGTAICCRKLAQLKGQDEGMLFTLGMLHNIGYIAVIRLYFRLFDQVLQEALKEAQDGQLKSEYDALRELQPDADFLRDLMMQYGAALSVKIIERMDMRRVYINHAMSEFAKDMPMTKMTPMAKILTQSVAYTRFRLLRDSKLITTDEAKQYLQHFHMPKGSLAILKSTNLGKLDLSMTTNTSDEN
ncbi:HDOD domain-containing protein [Neptunicella marina]|uniref:HDOD domain-containing protein n=1 Tax=Neptunicella marina TaxID=2125989 RepID=A0A8J6M148_9ALTE|nr:HDOD domain-containing protein [Neptunicella marina]MBC3767604.1 HDOD domain-containing protein [Neptunicella marina]